MSVDHPVFELGMSADHTLDVMKLSGRRFLRKPEEVGKDKSGLVVEWYLQDATLTLCRRRIESVTCYRIIDIEQPERKQ